MTREREREEEEEEERGRFGAGPGGGIGWRACGSGISCMGVALFEDLEESGIGLPVSGKFVFEDIVVCSTGGRSGSQRGTGC